MDPYKFLNIIPNPDGSLTRLTAIPYSQPTGYPDDSTPSQTSVASIDVLLNTNTNTWIRIFHPLNPPSTSTKLPIIIFFPACGFIIDTARTMPVNQFCTRMAIDLPAVILLVEYRLAPENRLPLAYEDAMDAMLWLKQQALHGEHKFIHSSDFTNCFLMGSSSGGNIAYHAGVRALHLDLEPVRINGLILNHPFFGGMERTRSELRYENDKVLPSLAADLMWELSLPIGADRNHEYCNPMVEGSHRVEIPMLPRCYVIGYGGDPLVDRQKEFVKMLEGHGVFVVANFVDDGYHAVELVDSEKAQALMMGMRDFIYSSETSDDVIYS